MIRSTAILLVLAAVTSACRAGDVLLDESGEFTADSPDAVKLSFTVDDADAALLLDTNVKLAEESEGKINVRVIDPDGEVLTDHGTGGWMNIEGQLVKTYGATGEFEVHVVPANALGTWSVRVALTEAPPPAEISPVNVVPGVGMVLVGLIAALWWRWQSGARWRWFWVGAAVWTVGVVLKFAWAIPLNGPILAAIEAVVPHNVYLVLGAIYIGLLVPGRILIAFFAELWV